MDRTNVYRKKTPHNASSIQDVRGIQDEKIKLLQARYPDLKEAVEDILAQVEWNVDMANDILQDVSTEIGGEGVWEDSDYADITEDLHHGLSMDPTTNGHPHVLGKSDTFLEITQAHSVQTKPAHSSKCIEKNDRPVVTPSLPQEGLDHISQMFPALPQVQGLRGYSPIFDGTSAVIEKPSTSTGILRDYHPVSGKMTVYNALQESSPWFQINESSWKTDFNGLSEGDMQNLVMSDLLTSEGRGPENESIHDDDINETDEDDWFSLQLEPQFVIDLFNSYSNPFGAIESERLLLNDLNIKIPPKLAFELFRHLCLNLLQKFPENTNGSSSGDSAEDEGEGNNLSDFGGGIGKEANITPDLNKIMELEMQLDGEDGRRVRHLRSKLQSNLATRLTFEHLRSSFPALPATAVETCFVECNTKYDATVEKLKSLYPTAYIPQGKNISHDKTAFREAVQSELQVLVENSTGGSKAAEPMTPNKLRLKARTHFFLMREYAQKRSECSHAPGIAEYYSEMSRLHAASMRKANKLLSDLIFAKNNGPGKPTDQVDLHELSVQEAMKRLVSFLQEREKSLRGNDSLQLKIICGRGKHSDVHGPRIGPAVVNHLHKCGYDFRDTHRDGYVMVTLRNRLYKPRKVLSGR